MKRKIFLRIGAFLVVSVMILSMLSGCISEKKETTTTPTATSPTAGEKYPTATIKLGYRLTDTTILVTETDFMKKYGIQFELVPYASGVEMRDGILAGDVVIGELGTGPVIWAMTHVTPDDLLIVGTTEQGGEKYRVVVPVDSPVKSFDELVGKKIGIKIGSGCYTAFLRYIAAKGWTVEDFDLLNVGELEAISAMEQKSVDAVIMWEPIPAVLCSKGIARELMNFGSGEGGQNLVKICNPVYWGVSAKWAKENPDLVSRFLAGYIELCYWVYDHPDEAARIIYNTYVRRGVEVEAPEIYKLSIEHEHLYPWLPDYLAEDTKMVAGYLVQFGKADFVPDVKSFIDKSYLEKASELCGIYPPEGEK